jgi:hypothetical protein
MLIVALVSLSLAAVGFSFGLIQAVLAVAFVGTAMMFSGLVLVASSRSAH